MVEVSRDGRRVYADQELYRALDGQVYPAGIKGWIGWKCDVEPSGGLKLDPGLPASGRRLSHASIRLEGGDSSSDTFCYP